MKITLDEYKGYLSKDSFIKFCKENGVIINKDYLDFLLENKLLTPEKIKTDGRGNYIYSLQKADIVGVLIIIKNCNINLYNFERIKKSYFVIIKSIFKDLNKVSKICYEIDKLINSFFAIKYKKLLELQDKGLTIEERNEEWEDYSFASEDFDRLGFKEHMEDRCSELMKKFDINYDYINNLRYRVGRLTIFNRSGLDNKIRNKYIKGINENDLIDGEYLNELIYKINYFVYSIGKGSKSVKDIIIDRECGEKERICEECGRFFQYSKITQVTCSRACSIKHKNTLKREKRRKKIK